VTTRALAKPESQADQPNTLLTVISKAVSDPDIDVDKMERLLAMYERVTNDNRRVAFWRALSAIQATMPQIPKSGRIVVKGHERSRYALLEDIDTVIRPMLAESGFSLTFDSASKDGKLFTLSCTLAHSEGHTETKSIVLPMDSSQFRSDVQSIGATVSYARRQLIKMHLNIVEAGEDTDGINLEAISDEQVVDLKSMVEAVGADTDRFLQFMGVDAIGAILKRDYKRAVSALESKRRQ
jgi:hypothetical protein